MAPDLDAVAAFCEVSEVDRKVLTSVRRPIVQLKRREGANVSPQVAPGIEVIGVMLPYTPLHYLLFDGTRFAALVMTSANLSEEPIVSRNEDLGRLQPLTDYLLVHNRKIHTRVDDSVVRTLRRSRGFAPHPVNLGFPAPEILACGGELKNVFCLTKLSKQNQLQ